MNTAPIKQELNLLIKDTRASNNYHVSSERRSQSNVNLHKHRASHFESQGVELQRSIENSSSLHLNDSTFKLIECITRYEVERELVKYHEEVVMHHHSHKVFYQGLLKQLENPNGLSIAPKRSGIKLEMVHFPIWKIPGTA